MRGSKRLSVITMLVWLFLLGTTKCLGQTTLLNLLNPPGAITDHTITLVWDNGDTIPANQHYAILQDRKVIDTTHCSYYNAEHLSPDSFYRFEILLQDKKGKTVQRSNTIGVRTKQQGRRYNIADFGAVADGRTLNTKAIQAAIDQCTQNGTVLVPKGVYITGALFFKSNMTLYLEEGAVLKGSTGLADYPLVQSSFEGTEKKRYASLINGGALCGEGIQDLSIRGKGTIDAEGETLYQLERAENKAARGSLLSLINGENSYIEGVSLLESPAWGVHLIYCNGITLEKVYINTGYDIQTHKYYHITNGDGLALSSSKNVFLFHSTISSQDDNVSIKSGRNEEGRRIGRSTEHVRIFDCRFLGGLGVVVGSEMSAGVRDVMISNCRYENTACVGELKAPWGRGGVIENITYKHITYRDTIHYDDKWVRGGICIDEYYGEDKPDFTDLHPVDEQMPSIRDAWFEDIRMFRKNGTAIYLCGRPERYLQHISLKNIRAEAPEGISGSFISQISLDQVTIRSSPGNTYHWQHVNGLTLH